MFRFSVSFDSFLEESTFLGIYPFLPACPIFWHILVLNISLIILYIFVVSTVTSPLLFLILLTWVLCFSFLMSLVKGLSILFIKKTQFKTEGEDGSKIGGS